MSKDPQRAGPTPQQKKLGGVRGSQPDDLQLDLIADGAGAWGSGAQSKAPQTPPAPPIPEKSAEPSQPASGVTPPPAPLPPVPPSPVSPTQPGPKRSRLWLFGLAIPVLLVGAAIWSFTPGGSDLRQSGGENLPSPPPASTAVETSAKNWKYVEQASQFTKGMARDQMAHLNAAGIIAQADYIGLSRDDLDARLKSDLELAMKSGGVEEASRVYNESHNIPAPDVRPGDPESPAAAVEDKVVRPTLTPGLQKAIAKNNADFIHLYMFDSCEEDGDVVEIVIDGAQFAVVPITHVGATLSVPVTILPTTIALRGIQDGGGGITVAFRTSQGHFFCRAMEVGEEVLIGRLEP